MNTVTVTCTSHRGVQLDLARFSLAFAGKPGRISDSLTYPEALLELRTSGLAGQAHKLLFDARQKGSASIETGESRP
jgi:hypothetical protein